MTDTDRVSELQPDYSRYRVPAEGAFSPEDIDPGDTQGLLKTRDAAALNKQAAQLRKRLDGLQQRLFAESGQALLLVLQAMDGGGKDSVVRNVLGPLNPQGCRVTNFRAPGDTELAHDFLWRVHACVPPHGIIGVFNRSHYEDVLVARVHGLAPPDLIEKRYRHINDFERMLSDHGTRIIKIMLRISGEFQLKRLQRRLQNPEKMWKFRPEDLRDRKYWDDYAAAYRQALARCSTPYAPWYVIPAEKRWFRDLIIRQLLVDTLEDMNPRFPEPQFDPADYPPAALR